MERGIVLIAGGGPRAQPCSSIRATGNASMWASLPSSIRVVLSTLGIELPSELVVRRPPSHLVYWGERCRGGEAGPTFPNAKPHFSSGGVPSIASSGRRPLPEVRLLPDAVSQVSRSKGAVEIRTVGGAEFRGRFFIDATRERDGLWESLPAPSVQLASGGASVSRSSR